MAAILKHLELQHGETLLVATAEHDVNVYNSARNIDRVSVSPVGDLNALSVLAPRQHAGDQGRAGCTRSSGQEAQRETAEAATEGLSDCSLSN